MALCNRVHPEGSLHSVAERGTLMGNRGGRIHDPHSRTLRSTRRWASKTWICCALSFKGRQRSVWGESYTELFFLDEVTALSSGHRPCFECRRSDALRFQRAFQRALVSGDDSLPRAGEMDDQLHQGRLETKRPWCAFKDLPHGAVCEHGDDVIAIHPSGALYWSFAGYRAAPQINADEPVCVLTSAPMLAILKAGYGPAWHPTADNADWQ